MQELKIYKTDKIIAVRKLLSKAKNVCIFSHINPDGDALGSSLGLMHFLTDLGINVKVVVPNDFPDFLNWMPGTKKILKFNRDEQKVRKAIMESDLFFILDFNNLSRLGTLGSLLTSSDKPSIMIDHHLEPAEGFSFTFSSVKSSSTSEMIYQFITSLRPRYPFHKNTATCLLTGIMTDTGCFRFPSTSAVTFKIASTLIQAGASSSDIYEKVFDDFSISRLQLTGFCLHEKLVFVPNLAVAFMTLSNAEQKQFQFKKGDTEGLVNYPLSVRGIQMSVFFSEREGEIRISFRSKGKFDVNKFARQHFNGGGHRNAAGGMSTRNLETTTKWFLETLGNYPELKNKKS